MHPKGKMTDADVLARIPPEVARELGYYVYLYFDPRSNSCTPFYVGKGHGNRALVHMTYTRDSRKVRLLEELKSPSG